MGYYSYYWNRTPTKYDRLRNLFGNSVVDIRRAFLALDGNSLEAMFIRYGRLYGKSPENYARKTFPLWKSGRTALSGQTMERLIELIPPYFSMQQRHDFLLKVIEIHKPSPQTIQVHINPKEPAVGLAEVDKALASLNTHNDLAFLPPAVMQAASWLYGDDMTVARAIIAEAQNAKNKNLFESARREIELLRAAISTGRVSSANYHVRTPTGELSVSVFEPSKCFVASVCFGADSKETLALRRWRDQHLMRTSVGRRFVSWYYRNGQSLSQSVQAAPLLLITARSALRLFINLLPRPREP